MIRYFGLILLAMSLFTTWKVAESRQSGIGAQEWKQTYSKVFANSAEELSSVQVGSHLIFLHKYIGVSNLDKSVTNDMRDNIEYIYSLLMDPDTEHCKVKYLDDVKERLSSILNTNVRNMDQVLRLIQRNLLLICADLYRKYGETFDDYYHYDTLLELMYEYEDYDEGKQSISELKTSVFKIMGVKGRYSEQKIRSLWNEKRCGILIAAMKVDKFEPFHEFAALSSYCGTKDNRKRPGTMYWWARIVFACDKLDEMMADFAKREPKPEKTSRIGRFFNYFH